MKNLLYLFFAVTLTGTSCKKPSNENSQSSDANQQAIEVYTSQKFNEAKSIVASFDGKTMVIQSTDENIHYNYSLDGGQTWATLRKGFVTNVLNNAGYGVSGENIFRLDGKERGFNYNVDQNEFLLGKDDYIYDLQRHKKKLSILKIGVNTWSLINDKADTLGVYCGQDQNGGIAFYKGDILSIHQPATDKWVHHKMNIDVQKVSNNIPNKKGIVHFNGYSKIAFGNADLHAVYDLNTKKIEYYNYPPSYGNVYTNPIALQIDKQGDVYLTISKYGGKPVLMKSTKGAYSALKNASYNYTNGDFAYEFTPFVAHKIGTQIENIDALITDKQVIKSAYVTDDFACLLYDITGGYSYYNGESSLGNIMLSIYDFKTKTERDISKFGYYNFVYADGKTIFLSGGDSVTVSTDGGNYWTRRHSPLTPNIKEIVKVGSVYYAMAIINSSYTSNAGITTYNYDFKMLTSPNLFIWTPLPGASKSGIGGGPSTFTRLGYLSAVTSVFKNTQYTDYSYDFGKTWASTTETNIPIFNTDFNDGKFTQINYSYTDNTIEKIVKDEKNKILSTIKYAVPSGEGKSYGLLRNPIITDSKKLYYISGTNIYRLGD